MCPWVRVCPNERGPVCVRTVRVLYGNVPLCVCLCTSTCVTLCARVWMGPVSGHTPRCVLPCESVSVSVFLLVWTFVPLCVPVCLRLVYPRRGHGKSMCLRVPGPLGFTPWQGQGPGDSGTGRDRVSRSTLTNGINSTTRNPCHQRSVHRNTAETLRQS